MTDLRKAAQQALEKIAMAHAKIDALCLGNERWTMSVPARPDHDHDLVISGALYAAAEVLRAALAQPADMEPVAAQHRFRHPQKNMPGWSVWQPCAVSDRPKWEVDSQGYEVEYRNLYTHPPARVPLTDEEIALALGFGEFTTESTKVTLTAVARAIEAAEIGKAMK